jgi:hypothetical protein
MCPHLIRTDLQGLPAAYVDVRRSTWQQLQSCAAALQPDAAVLPFDALRLLDLAVSQGLLLPDHSNLQLLLGACLLVVVQSGGGSGPGVAADTQQHLQQLLQVEGRALAGAAEAVQALLQDTSLMSAYRVATLLLQATAAGSNPAQVGPPGMAWRTGLIKQQAWLLSWLPGASSNGTTHMPAVDAVKVPASDMCHLSVVRSMFFPAYPPQKEGVNAGCVYAQRRGGAPGHTCRPLWNMPSTADADVTVCLLYVLTCQRRRREVWTLC